VYRDLSPLTTYILEHRHVNSYASMVETKVYPNNRRITPCFRLTDEARILLAPLISLAHSLLSIQPEGTLLSTRLCPLKAL